MVMPVIETSSFAVPADKLKKASLWWNSKTEAQQRALIKVYKIVTWEHVISLWEREMAK
jgi:hypothetical protein